MYRLEERLWDIFLSYKPFWITIAGALLCVQSMCAVTTVLLCGVCVRAQPGEAPASLKIVIPERESVIRNQYDDAEFICHLTNFQPKTKVTWYFIDSNMTSTQIAHGLHTITPRYELSPPEPLDPNSYTFVHNLHISRINMADDGLYQCSAVVNASGVVPARQYNDSKRLIIRVPVEIHANQHHINALLNDQALLTWKIIGHPKPPISRFHILLEGHTINRNLERYTILSSNLSKSVMSISLHIAWVQREDIGLYTLTYVNRMNMVISARILLREVVVPTTTPPPRTPPKFKWLDLSSLFKNTTENRNRQKIQQQQLQLQQQRRQQLQQQSRQQQQQIRQQHQKKLQQLQQIRQQQQARQEIMTTTQEPVKLVTFQTTFPAELTTPAYTMPATTPAIEYGKNPNIYDPKPPQDLYDPKPPDIYNQKPPDIYSGKPPNLYSGKTPDLPPVYSAKPPDYINPKPSDIYSGKTQDVYTQKSPDLHPGKTPEQSGINPDLSATKLDLETNLPLKPFSVVVNRATTRSTLDRGRSSTPDDADDHMTTDWYSQWDDDRPDRDDEKAAPWTLERSLIFAGVGAAIATLVIGSIVAGVVVRRRQHRKHRKHREVMGRPIYMTHRSQSHHHHHPVGAQMNMGYEDQPHAHTSRTLSGHTLSSHHPSTLRQRQDSYTMLEIDHYEFPRQRLRILDESYTVLEVDHYEFPRQRLRILDEVGRGKFGQIVLGEALNILGDGKWTTVAVKMAKVVLILDEVGQGKFGQIVLGEALNILGDGKWTVKMAKDTATDYEKEDIRRELEIMRMYPRHPNVVMLLGCCIKEDPALIIMEYLGHGNLQDYLRKSRPNSTRSQTLGIHAQATLTAKDLTQFSWQASRGMAHISSYKIIHRDLAARNILVGTNRVCKVADFGLARSVAGTDQYERNSRFGGLEFKGGCSCIFTTIIHRDLAARNILVGTNRVCKVADFGLARSVAGTDHYERNSKGPLPVRWMAPETFHDAYYTDKSDVWAYGILLWEIVTLGASPYPGQTAEDVMKFVMSGDVMAKPPHCEDQLYTIMCRCWCNTPDKRPTFNKLTRMLEELLESEEDYIELKDYEESDYMYIKSTSKEKC